jgi:hypothetical protein
MGKLLQTAVGKSLFSINKDIPSQIIVQGQALRDFQKIRPGGWRFFENSLHHNLIRNFGCLSKSKTKNKHEV